MTNGIARWFPWSPSNWLVAWVGRGALGAYSLFSVAGALSAGLTGCRVSWIEKWAVQERSDVAKSHSAYTITEKGAAIRALTDRIFPIGDA